MRRHSGLSAKFRAFLKADTGQARDIDNLAQEQI